MNNLQKHRLYVKKVLKNRAEVTKKAVKNVIREEVTNKQLISGRLKRLGVYRKKRKDVQKNSRAVFVLLGAVITYNIFIPFPTFSESSNFWLLNFGEIVGEEVDSDDSDEIVFGKFAREIKPGKVGLPEIEKWDRAFAIKTYQSQVTAYNSLPGQTSGNPFITASGSRTGDGVIAANCLAFGTKVRFPEYSGDKVYTVEDRLAPRKGCYIMDIWQEHYSESRAFGAPVLTVEILEGSPEQSLGWVS